MHFETAPFDMYRHTPYTLCVRKNLYYKVTYIDFSEQKYRHNRSINWNLNGKPSKFQRREKREE